MEGPTDVLAMTAAGLAAIGRPSNGGRRHLAEFINTNVPPERELRWRAA